MVGNFQSMTCDVRSQVASCDVGQQGAMCTCEPILVKTCDVCACGAFLGLRSVIATSHIFLAIMQDMKIKNQCNVIFITHD